MKLGIDFGTTRVVVAAVEAGQYPVVALEGPPGEPRDWFPPLLAARGGERRYGWQAWAAQAEPGWTVVRSLKRLLSDSDPDTPVRIADQTLPIHQLMAELVGTLKTELIERSSLRLERGEALEALLGVPANANSNQRFLTVDAFRRAGFEVLGLLSEPSAASLEFGQRPAGPQEPVLIYDLGGGTFDASLVELDGRFHLVTGTAGIARLGGDDFDHLLADLSLEAAGIGEAEREDLSAAEWFRLHELSRRNKEALGRDSREIRIELGEIRSRWPAASLPLADFYQACRPLIDRTTQVVDDLLARSGIALDYEGWGRPLGAFYLTGGGSELPLVSSLLHSRFGRRVRRAARARSVTAVGLALQADAAAAGYAVRESLPRYFGVWREDQGGRKIVFDVLFPKDAVLPTEADQQLAARRSYSPAHNVGHFRYLECSHLADDGSPSGDITVWDEVRFPFDPAARDEQDLQELPIGSSPAAADQTIEEVYTYDRNGTVAIAIANHSGGYGRRYRLTRRAAAATPVEPGRRPPRRRAAAAAGALFQ